MRGAAIVVVCLAAAGLTAGPPLPQPPNPRYVFHRPEHQGPLNKDVRWLFQDRVGFLWMSRGGAPVRFDGREFRGFKVRGPGSEGAVKGMVHTLRGELWIALRDRALARLRGDTFETVPFPAGAVLSSASSVLALDDRDRPCVALESGLGVLEDGDAAAFKLFPLPSEAPLVLGSDKERRVWAISGEQAGVLTGGNWHRLRVSGLEPGLRLESAAFSGSGHLWVAGGTRVFVSRLPAGLEGGLPEALDFRPEPLVESLGRVRVLLDAERNPLIATDEGLLVRRQGRWERLSRRNGMGFNSVRTALEDRAGNLWVGYAGGGVEWTPGWRNWKGWSIEDGLPHESVWGIFRDEERRLWVGTTSNIAVLNREGTAWGYVDPPITALREIRRTADGSVWAYASPGDVYRIDTRTLKSSRVAIPGGPGSARGIGDGPSGALWVFSGGAVLSLTGESLPIPLDLPASVPPSLFLSRRAPDGAVWAASLDGLLRFHEGAWTRFAATEGLRSNALGFGLEPRSSSDVWFGYRESLGVSRLSVQDGNVTLTHFRETEGVTDSVYFIGHDHKENVWIGTPDGAVVLPKGGKPHRLNSLDGLLWNDCNGDGFFLDADEAIWIGTSGGLARYDQTPVGATPPPPRVFLTSVSFGSLKPALDESPRVSWKDRRFSVAFFALSVEDPGEVTYSYRLHGYSATDIVTKASTAEFGGLPPGRYRFEVSARSPRGGASVQNASFSFEVSPAWWATYWFAILCGAVLVLSGFLLVRGRTAALILGKRALERTVTERTAQLQRLSHAVEQAASAIIITDVSGRIEFANCAFSRITGYTAEEVIGKTPRVIQSGQTPAGVYSKLWSTIISGRTWRGEMLNRRKDGSLFWELTIISPILDSSGRITHFVAVNEDITERKRTEEELLQAREKAEAASIAKGSFLANMSHEIRTPMNGIIGMTELLLGTPLSSTQRGFAETVWASADSLLTIVNDILDLSRIEAGKLSLEMAEFDIRTLVEETATSLAGRLQGTDVAFACFVHTRVPTWVTGDATRIRQLLTNLVGNAMKFTVTGEVVVEVGVAGEGELPASVRFEIRDTGPGIPASQLKELFKPFVQADSSRSRSHGGTGLGLVISKRLVELMGGEIGLESEEGRGAVAHFTIPLGRAARAGKGPTDVSVNVSGMPVLVAEARTLHAKALRSLLTRWDCRVTEVNSWAEANSALCGAAGAGHPFRAAFLDWSLPGIPEPRLLRRPQQGPVHFILLSSQNDIVEVSREYADHVLAFLSRPVTRAALMRALEKVETGIGQSQPLVFPSPVFSTAPSRRVLVVEDHEVNRKVIYRILERLGHVADLVENGAEAIEALQRRCYDVVLMDVQMPVLDGLETTRRIRSGSAGVIDKDIPIVALTAHAMKGDREECSAAGMTDFIAKPIQSVELALAVERSTRPTPPSHATLAPKYRSPSFDPAALRQRLLGDEEALRDVLEQFLVSFGGEIDRLRGEVAAANVLDVRNLAHRLKGMLGMIGAAGLSQLAGELEVLAAEGKVEAMPVLTQRFHGEATDLARDVRRYLAGETRGEEGAAS